jgi:hypothetical protein
VISIVGGTTSGPLQDKTNKDIESKNKIVINIIFFPINKISFINKIIFYYIEVNKKFTYIQVIKSREAIIVPLFENMLFLWEIS